MVSHFRFSLHPIRINEYQGWRVYTQNLWSFLDVTFSAIFGIYLILRIHGLRKGELVPAQQAMDVLAMGAPVLVPRLAFNLMSENMLFISLREMMRDFTVLTVLAVWCSAGFLLSMVWLSNGAQEPITISKWMLWVWFGLDGTGIQRSVDFHWLLGPILMVAFAVSTIIPPAHASCFHNSRSSYILLHFPNFGGPSAT